MIKTVLGILTYNRTELLFETLSSLLMYNKFDGNEIVLLDNGSSKSYRLDNSKLASNYGIHYIYNNTDIGEDINSNIELGHYFLINEMLKYKADLYCVLEDDWKCTGKIPINAIHTFLANNLNVGQVRLRDYRYDDSFYGGSSKHFITGNKIVFDENIFIDDNLFEVADMHWVNCCNMMRRDAIECMCFRANDEIEKMKVFYETFPRNAQIRPGIFYHIGPNRIRADLREKGLF